MRTRALLLFFVGTMLAGAGAVAAAAVRSDGSGVRICGRDASTAVEDRYLVANNRWDASAEQCLTAGGGGFSIVSQSGTGDFAGAPVSNPAVGIGCQYQRCSPNTGLPVPVGTVTSAVTAATFRYVSDAAFDAGYTVRLAPGPHAPDAGQLQIMIWLRQQGAVQPIGSRIGSSATGGRKWDVWAGQTSRNGSVLSFLASEGASDGQFDAVDFIHEAVGLGLATNAWFLTSIQAGFEPWSGGVGLAVTAFSASVIGSGGAQVGTRGGLAWDGADSSGGAGAPATPGGGGSPVPGPSLTPTDQRRLDPPAGQRVRGRAAPSTPTPSTPMRTVVLLPEPPGG